ncbi:HU family DNA-binding protein [Acidithiobacillus sulfuriphilus]|uniref:HU family DNA-binding protein n=1 Tax=Acidithiobacillus sulfuriphilus TaxID=1867749 RepID=A0A3M8QQ23_9PROT|nr:hypothetical protein EC580_14115 [Acidithiobacillus sulfuriphilus]
MRFVRQRGARSGRNPATAETVRIPAKHSVHFKAAEDPLRRIPMTPAPGR